jgi:hypothetical protein
VFFVRPVRPLVAQVLNPKSVGQGSGRYVGDSGILSTRSSSVSDRCPGIDATRLGAELPTVSAAANVDVGDVRASAGRLEAQVLHPSAMF